MVKNINELYGDVVEFDSVDEMIESINSTECLDNVEYLTEGIDYEIVD